MRGPAVETVVVSTVGAVADATPEAAFVDTTVTVFVSTSPFCAMALTVPDILMTTSPPAGKLAKLQMLEDVVGGGIALPN